MNMISSEMLAYVLDRVVSIQQIPAPTFSEQNRAAAIFEEMNMLGLQVVHYDQAGNVLGLWPGGDAAPLILSAHLDTVHPESILPVQRTGTSISGPGIADNSMGLAALLGVGFWLKQTGVQFPGPIWLVADVCEEGLGNLAGMKTLVNRFEENVLAYIVLEGLGLGQICHRGLGVIRYRISVETLGGHAWVNFGTPSAIHELAGMIHGLTEIAIPREPRTSLNVGMIQGGTSVNTIARKAWCEIDLRSEDSVVLNHIGRKIHQIVGDRARNGVHVNIDLIGSRAAGFLSRSHPLTQLAASCLEELGLKPKYEIGSTDANIPLSLGYPAICLGITRGNNPHTFDEVIELEPIQSGLQQLILLIQRAWSSLSEKL